MRNSWILRVAGLALGVLFAPSSVSAHHATAAEYDISKTVVLKGTITRIDWFNPHIHVYIDVKADSRHEETWAVEFPSPGATIVAGLSRQLLMPGTVLTLEGYPGKADFHPEAAPHHFACAKGITLSDGSHFGFVVGI
jgi:Family of unknown function (DUF6152)